MTSHRWSSTLAAALASLTAGCDPVWTLRADVGVDPATQASLSVYPSEVVASYEREDGNITARLGYVCSPSDAAFTTEAVFVAIGCGRPGRFVAWLQPAQTAPSCGPLPEKEYMSPAQPDPAAPQAAQDVFSSGSCPRRDDVVLVIGR